MGSARVLILVAALGVVLVAAAPADAAPTPSPADAAILAAGVIQPTDVPGWQGQDVRPGTTSQFKGVAACQGIATAVDAAQRNVPAKPSQQFSDPTSATGTTVAQGTVFAFKTAKAASDFVAAYKSSSAATCFKQVAQKGLKSGLKGIKASFKVTPIAYLAGIGDDHAGYDVALTLQAQGQQQMLYGDIAIVRVGRAVLRLNFQYFGAPLPQGPGLTKTTVARVAQAGA